MAELTNATAKSLKSWNCHFCFVLPDHLQGAKLSNEVALELKDVIQDAIKISVENSVQSVIINNVVEEANQRIAKSWAQIASGEQTKLIAEVVEVTCAPALAKSVQLIEANLNERRNRAKNIVVSNLPDSEDETEDGLKELICNTVKNEIAPADIVTARRIGAFGKPSERAKRTYRGRLVIATLKREDDATYLHRNGRGYAIWGKSEDENVWVNSDQPKADRDAKMLKRQGKTNSEVIEQRKTRRAGAKFKPSNESSEETGQAQETEVNAKEETPVEVNAEKEAEEGGADAEEVVEKKEPLEDTSEEGRENKDTDASQDSKNDL